jgi:hypothetical protein
MTHHNHNLADPELSPDVGRPYFNAILDHAHVIGRAKEAQEYLDQKWKEQGGKPTWEDLFRAEMAAIQTLPEEDLEHRLPELCEEFKQFYGGDSYDKCFPTGPGKQSVDHMRADASYLEREIQRMRLCYNALQLMQDRSRLRGAFLAVLVVAAAGLFLGAWLGFMHPVLVFLPAMLMGAAGGVTSLLIRRRRMPITEEQDLHIRLLHLGIMPACRFAMRWISVVCALEGAIGGAVVCLLLQSGLIQGAVIPNLDLNPLPGAELAKLMIWAFLGGFSERFMPDLLGRVSAPVSTTTGGTPAGSTSAGAKKT